ncbi:MAG: right-handed parallel beta-helix repeat-containing protein [Candidatus Thorarchaeota archaeon]|nr:MAG: right-handed parallel beta-helix repeat-containing protein [Candidatus Thorarchaeota archaeon]
MASSIVTPIRVCILLICMLAVFGVPGGNPDTEVAYESTRRFSVSDYIIRPEINVTSDAELDALGLPGYGNSTHPYLIEWCDYTGSTEESVVTLQTTTRHVAIQHCLFGGTGVPVNLWGADNVHLFNNTFVSGWRDVYVSSCDNLVITNNTFLNNLAIYYSTGFVVSSNAFDSASLYCQYADDSIIENNMFTRSGIRMERGVNVTFANNLIDSEPIGYFEGIENTTISGTPYAQIIVHDSRNVTIADGYFSKAGSTIQLCQSTNCTISDMDILDAWSGVSIIESNKSTVRGVNLARLDRSPVYGIGMSESENISVVDCIMTDIGIHGLNAYYSDAIVIRNNTFQNSGDGVLISNSSNVLLFNNTIKASTRSGIHLYGTSESIVFNNTITNSGEQAILILSLYDSSVDIYNNQISAGPVGVQAENCTNGPLIRDNSIVSFSEAGVNLQESTNVTVLDNIFQDCGLAMNLKCVNWQTMGGLPLPNWKHNISLNTVNGRDLVYWNGVDLNSVPGTAGQVWLVDCSEIAVSGLDFSNSSIGCAVIYSDNVTISGITSYYNHFGAWIVDGSNCHVEDSQFSYNFEGVFLYHNEFCLMENNTLLYNYEQTALWGCYGANITDNEFGNNMGVGVLGSYGTIQNYASSNATIVGNIFHDAWCGMYIQVCYNNSFVGNTIYSTWNGLWLDRVWDAYIADNHINESTTCLNIWYSDNNTFVNNYADNSIGYGGSSSHTLYINLSNNTRIDNCTFKARSDGDRLIIDAINVSILDSVLTGGSWGVLINDSYNVLLEQCDIADISNGLFIQRSDFTRVDSCEIILNEATVSKGIFANYSSSCSIINTTILSPSQYSIQLQWSPYAVCINNTVENGASHGIWFRYSPNSIAFDNTVRNCTNAIHVYQTNNCVVNASYIEDCRMGIAIWGGQGHQVCDNVLFRSGVHLDNQYIDVNNNWINDRPIGFFANLTGGNLDATGYGHIALANCENMQVFSGEFWNVSEGISLYYCRDIVVFNITVNTAYELGVNFESCTNCTVRNFTISDCGINGIRIVVSSDCSVYNGTILTSNHGIYIYDSTDSILTNCTSIDSLGHGIYLNGANRTAISNCTIDNSGSAGIVVFNSDYCEIWNNTAFDCGEEGLELDYVEHTIVQQNEFYSNHHYGNIHIRESNNVTVILNLLCDGYYRGILIETSSNCKMINNTIRNNTWYGIEIGAGCSGHIVFGNIIAYNGMGNALDNGFSNTWDNGGPLGNKWSDYSGLGDYDVPGTASSVDRFPEVYDTADPTIDNPADVEYDFGDAVPNLVWAPRDDHPNSYEVFRNGISVASGPWGGGDIQVSVSGLPLGAHNYTIYVVDLAGNWNADLVWVTVYVDTTPPTIDSPSDFTMTEGTTGNNVTWTPSDNYPSHYTLYIEEAFNHTSVWDGFPIVIGIDSLTLGVYNLTIVVHDQYGHNVSDAVFVTVEDTTPPSIDGPADILYFVGQTGNVIRWNVSDPHILNALVLKDGLQDASAQFHTTFVNISIDGLSLGTYNYTVVVWDTESNEAYDIVWVTVWNPDVPMIDNPPDVSFLLGETGYNITWDPETSHPSSYDLLRDNSSIASGPWDNSSITTVLDGLSVGVYYYTLIVWDLSGYNNSDTVIVEVIETDPPIVDTPPDLQMAEGQLDVNITWTVSDDHPGTYLVLENSSEVANNTWTGPTILFNLTGYAKGAYNFTIIVYDENGFWSADEVIVEVLDLTPPDPGSPTDITYGEGSTGNWLTWPAADNYPSSYQILKNGTEEASGPWAGTDISILVDGLAIGDHNYTLIVWDTTGNNASDTVIVHVVWETTPPSIDSPPDIYRGEWDPDTLIVWSPWDQYPDIFEILQDGVSVDSGSWNGSAISWSTDYLTRGTYNFTLIVGDSSSINSTDTVMVYVTDNRNPVIGSPADIYYVEGEAGNFINWTLQEDYYVSHQVFRNGSSIAGSVYGTSFIYISVSGLAPGLWNYTLIVTDIDSNTGSDSVLVTVLESGIPLINSPSDVGYIEGTTGHAITWNPVTENPTNYEVLHNGSLFDSGTWSSPIVIVIDGLSVGYHNMTMTVWDSSGGSASDTVFVTVTFNPPPTIDSPADIKYVESLGLGFVVWRPSDANPDSYTVYLNGSVLVEGPWAGSSINVNISGLAHGRYNVTMVVYDTGGKTANDTVIVWVVYELNPPQILGPPDIEYTYGDTGNTAVWSTYDENPFHYMCLHNGSIMTEGDWSTTTLSVNIDGLSFGSHNVTLVLYDVDMNSASDTLIVRVLAVDAPRLSQSPGDSSFDEGTGAITWSFSSPFPESYEILVNGTIVEQGEWNGSEITYDVSGLPHGVYNITAIAHDETGGSTSDSVLIQINENVPGITIDNPIIQIASLAAIVVIALAAYRIIKQGTKEKKEEDWRDMLDDFTEGL